jgi:ABC-type nitrate/sulfonate/bicarbonate transport system ATPase subunit
MEHATLVDVENADVAIAQRLKLTVRALRIRRGTIAVMLGPNGSGKSTLARFLCRINGPERVQASREARPVPATVMVWQSLNLFPLTVLRNVEIVRKAGGEIALKYFKLWVLRKAQADSISGGERQKLAIVRSLVTEADLVVLDEPTSSLDSRSVYELAEVIGAYTSQGASRSDDYLQSLDSNRDQQLPKAMLIITHDVRFVRMLARFERLRVFTVSNDQRVDGDSSDFVLNSGANGEGYTIDQVHTHPPDLFAADFFGVANVIGFTAAVGKPRGHEDLCARYVPEAVGWVVLRDEAIEVREIPSDGGANLSALRANFIGSEYVGSEKRARLLVSGRHGEFELTVPSNVLPGDHTTPLEVAIKISDQSMWSIVGSEAPHD